MSQVFEYREFMDKIITNPTRRLSYSENYRITCGGKMDGGGSSWYKIEQKELIEKRLSIPEEIKTI